jgi:hypothetical protein
MKKPALSKLLVLKFAIILLCVTSGMAQSIDTTLPVNSHTAVTENAAPSEHIFFDFPTDAIAKIHKIKIIQSADAEYFSVHNFRGGYNGLQQTPDKDYGTSYILIASLWDPNTAGKVFSKVAYPGNNTFTSRFGGEGDGWKTINPYKWDLNIWYNIAIRAWKSNSQLYVATFIQNTTTGVWLHTSTLAQPDRLGFLGSGNDAFLENWDGTNSLWDGRFTRKAFFRDCWNLSTNNVWEKHKQRRFYANDGDEARNGKYNNSFNAGYDPSEDAYFMQHGGDCKPDKAFGTNRGISLPEQIHQGDAPKLTIGALTAVKIKYADHCVKLSWTTDVTKSPQLSSKIEIMNSLGKVIQTVDEVLPEKRYAVIKASLPVGRYTAHVTITDIFNQVSKVVEKEFVVKK